MPVSKVIIGAIQSYQPVVDARSVEGYFILDGRNFAWDASGPFAAYASRLLSGNDVILSAPHIVQSLDFDTTVFQVGGNNVYEWDGNFNWDAIQTLVPVEADPYQVQFNHRRWSTAYLGAGTYAANVNYGLFKYDSVTNKLVKKTSADIPGLPAGILSITETNGRMIYLTATTVYWSGANAPEDLTPAVGGPGFQVLAARVSGEGVILTSIPNGFIAWTTTGALVAEFIGGDNVFRFFPMTTDVIPLSAFAIEKMADGSHVMLTKLGMYRTVNGSQPEPITPLFNEFLREYLRSQAIVNGGIFYSVDEGRIYVMFRRSTDYFTTTYALETTLDKWGVFSVEHFGFMKYTTGRGRVGYVDRNGIASMFTPKSSKFRRRELSLAPGEFAGLDSFITIGQIRHPQLMPTADATQEVQEVVVYRQDLLSPQQDLYVDEGQLDEPMTLLVEEGNDLTSAPSPASTDETADITLSNPAKYGLEVEADLFGFGLNDQPIMIPELAERRIETDLWVGLSSGFYHRLKFTARVPGEFYHITHALVTLSYTGQQA